MNKDLIKELSWRGLLQNYTPELQNKLKKKINLYTGFDPTADSLHIGNLLPIITLLHFKKFGHKPIIIIGGATGMIGDPSGKLRERQFLDNITLLHNINCIKKQLNRLLNFKSKKIKLLNNYEWICKIHFIEFLRDIGKYITINYMISKDSIKKRINNSIYKGISFTEFTYQILQAYDFFYLFQNEKCILQIGGSDQWGNITTGIELIRKKINNTAYGLTLPLITKSDGSKFGKSQNGENIWLESRLTSPYKFFQFWINTSDEEAKRFIKMYTFLSKEKINQLIKNHQKNPSKRILQKHLASEITRWIHGNESYKKILNISEFLFKKKSIISKKTFNKKIFLSLFKEIPHVKISIKDLKNGINIIDILVKKSNFLNSKKEAKRALKEKSILINRKVVNEDFILSEIDILEKCYILIQIGKKNFYILKIIKN